MTKTNQKPNEAIWELIDREKKKDAFVKRVSRVAWIGTVVMLLVFLSFTLIDLSRMVRLYNRGAVAFESVIETIVPFAVILGSLFLIIAILATIGMFLRMRTTSLLEIQQRLASLEEVVTTNK